MTIRKHIVLSVNMSYTRGALDKFEILHFFNSCSVIQIQGYFDAPYKRSVTDKDLVHSVINCDIRTQKSTTSTFNFKT